MNRLERTIVVAVFVLIAFCEIRSVYRRFHQEKGQFVWRKKESMSGRKKILAGMLLVLLAGLLSSLWPKNIAVPERVDAGYVQDFAGILSDTEKQRLELQSQRLAQQRVRSIFVVTVPKLNGEDIDDYTEALIEKWQLGDEHAEHGAVMLVAANDRKIRLDVADELSGALPESKLNHILDALILPEFKLNQMDAGVENGYQALYLSLDKDELPAPQENRAEKKLQAVWNQIKTWLWLLIFFLLPFSGRNGGGGSGDSWNDSDSSGGSSGSDGGGGSSGGNGSW